MKESNRLSDTQATVILTALAVLMLGAIWWGVSHPARDRQPVEPISTPSIPPVFTISIGTNKDFPVSASSELQTGQMEMEEQELDIVISQPTEAISETINLLTNLEMQKYGSELEIIHSYPPSTVRTRLKMVIGPHIEVPTEASRDAEGK